MPPTKLLSAGEFDKLRQLDTCTVSNAIERFDVRPRNEGFIYRAIRCRFPNFSPMLGYAVTARLRSSSPPATSPPITRGCYYDRMDFWRYLVTVPEPRVMVLQDADHSPGFGAFVGEVHARIALALHCVGCVTNGAVRDLPAVEDAGFHLFSGNLSVSHAYAHIVDFGEPVEIGGLKIYAGDLVHGDRHGVHTIPLGIAAEIPKMAAVWAAKEGELIAFCQSPGLTMDSLAAKLSSTSHSDLDLCVK
ncbi:MAG: RraA family protein [Bryobacteraceae bacterium]|jgi:regulator of RNase E activity RraA